MSMYQHMLGHATSFKPANDGQDVGRQRASALISTTLR